MSVPLTGDTVNNMPLHTVAVFAAITGTGLIVTVTLKAEPVQIPAVGITLYIAVCGVLVGLVSVPVIEAPLPAIPPVRPPVTTGTPQVYVVLAGTIPLTPFTGVTVKAVPLHADPVIAVTAGPGLTVTMTVKVEPVHVPDAGVTVYVAVCDAAVGFVSVPDMFAPAPATPPVIPPVTTGTPHE